MYVQLPKSQVPEPSSFFGPTPAAAQLPSLPITCAAHRRGSAASAALTRAACARERSRCPARLDARSHRRARPHRSAAGEGRAEDAVFFSRRPAVMSYLVPRPSVSVRSRALPLRFPSQRTHAFAGPAEPRPAPQNAERPRPRPNPNCPAPRWTAPHTRALLEASRTGYLPTPWMTATSRRPSHQRHRRRRPHLEP